MKIAIIGGIGSGKSAVVHTISGLGYIVCDCDAIYKEICTTKEYIDKIDKYFDVVKDGIIDKKALSEIVFSDKEKLALLNSIAHPLVFDRVDKLSQKSKDNIFIEVSAFDIGMKDRFDKIIFVDCPHDKRVERILERNPSLNKDMIEKIMSSQMDIEKMKSISDYVIVNDSDMEELRKKVKAMLKDIK